MNIINKCKFLIILTGLFLIFADAQPVNAQQIFYGNSWCTKIGNPSGESPCKEELGSILEFASKITPLLKIGEEGYFNRLETAFTNGNYSTGTTSGVGNNLYWCTYLIIDAYNMAGYTGLNKAAHGAVVTMRAWWKTAPGYKYIDYQAGNAAVFNTIKPGWALFWEAKAGEHTGTEHVGIIKSIDVNSRGDGEIWTYESNSTGTSHRMTVSGWNIQVRTAYPLRGFGGV